MHSQKLDLVGKLAGGIAHDFNNLLTVITGNVAIVESELPPDSPHHAELEEVTAAAHSAAGLTRQLLTFSRRSVVEPKVIDVAAVLEPLQRLLARLLGEDLELVLRVDGAGLNVFMDPGHLEQVLVNLSVNARDAMKGRPGTLLIEARIESLDVADGEVPPGEYVTLTVTDEGEGMTEEVKHRIFEAFFTTKSTGTGLGLATVHGIVKQAGGAITVSSSPGLGATFRVLLPRSTQPLEARASTQVRARPSVEPRHDRVVLVEDDPAVRSLAVRALESAGFAVEAFSGGEELIAELAPADRAPRAGLRAEDRAPVMVTDVVLRGMNGLEVSRRLRQRWPDARVLFTSGHTDRILEAEETRAATFLAKPYTPDQLVEKVAVLVRESASR